MAKTCPVPCSSTKCTLQVTTNCNNVCQHHWTAEQTSGICPGDCSVFWHHVDMLVSKSWPKSTSTSCDNCVYQTESHKRSKLLDGELPENWHLYLQFEKQETRLNLNLRMSSTLLGITRKDRLVLLGHSWFCSYFFLIILHFVFQLWGCKEMKDSTFQYHQHQ